MGKHVTRTMPQVAVPPRGIALHELEYEVDSGQAKICWPRDDGRALLDPLIQDVESCDTLVERRMTREHLEDEYAQCIPVNAFIVWRLSHNLPRNRTDPLLHNTKPKLE